MQLDKQIRAWCEIFREEDHQQELRYKNGGQMKNSKMMKGKDNTQVTLYSNH